MVILVHAYVDSARSLKAHFVHSSGMPARCFGLKGGNSGVSREEKAGI